MRCESAISFDFVSLKGERLFGIQMKILNFRHAEDFLDNYFNFSFPQGVKNCAPRGRT